MKLKNYIIVLLTCFISAGVVFADPDFSRPMQEKFMENHQMKPNMQPPHSGMIGKHPSPEEFERRLNLTEEQKAFAKEQRAQSIEKIKPILDEIKVKKGQLEQMKLRGEQTEAAAKLENEIKELRHQAHEIRKSNMKAFEATLTDEQRKELQKMKNEGRKEFERERKGSVQKRYTD